MKKAYRVKKNDEIETIIRHGDKVRSPYFSCYKKPNEAIGHFRFAVSTPKACGKAHARNRLKRRVRAIVREADIREDYDIFVIVNKKAADIDFQTMRADLMKLLEKHQLTGVKVC